MRREPPSIFAEPDPQFPSSEVNIVFLDARGFSIRSSHSFRRAFTIMCLKSVTTHKEIWPLKEQHTHTSLISLAKTIYVAQLDSLDLK